ncbi:signal recognition particle 19 kDa protein isoform X3 [Ornithorhynchus anatinus]|uniref:signal recognition particle 19 kDa protein isoform X3 n=1 Tax=Ornithorhynchus anatinus TaxID=9258 RepID=UPI000224038D|nr:signal recognition particle 19 kDa protein isoform X3 [Ornithorhynchus anatinus]
MRRMRRRFGRRVFCTLATSASPTRRKDSGGTMAYDEMSPADKDRFICIYPAYLNNKKTIAEGRRIPVEKKNKMYSREWNRDMQYRGRVRIQLKRDDGSLCFPQFPSRKSVMLYAAEMIPKLKTRTQKSGSGDHNYQLGDGGKKGKGKKKK